jgi:hypothetical protein
MGLRRQALDYGDEASQYGFETFEEYKKQNRGGLKGAARGAATGAKIGAGIGTAIGTAIPIPVAGSLIGAAGGTIMGSIYGAGAGLLSGNRKMKKEYLKYAKAMTELGASQGVSQQQLDAQKKAEEEARAKAAADLYASNLKKEKAKYQYGLSQPMVGGEMPMYKNGGIAKMVTINVEKGELAVDPRTMKIIIDFKDMPKHPKGKNVINQDGNVKVPVGTIIIPADKRKEFLSAKPAQRIEIAGEIIESQREKEQGEEMEMEEQMPMQGKGMGKGMMAMMGGMEEGGDEMEQEKMMNGGYVKKYVDGGDVYYDSTGQPYSYNAYGEAVAIKPGTESTYDPSKNVRELSSATTDQSAARTTGGGGGSSSNLAGGLGTALGMVGSAIPQYFLGRKQEREAKKALEELQKTPMAKYKPTTELEKTKKDTEIARERARYGFSAEELAARQQQVAQSQRTALEAAKATGLGGQSQAMLAALGSQRLAALNEMAITDARLREQKAQYADTKQASLAQQYQSLANQQTAADINYRLMQERAYGQALQQGLENKYGAYSTLGAGLGYGVGAVAGNVIQNQQQAGTGLTALLSLL